MALDNLRNHYKIISFTDFTIIGVKMEYFVSFPNSKFNGMKRLSYMQRCRFKINRIHLLISIHNMYNNNNRKDKENSAVCQSTSHSHTYMKDSNLVLLQTYSICIILLEICNILHRL